MEPQLLVQLGVAGATLYILWDYLKRTDVRIDNRDRSFTKFVDEHNDAMAELVRESTRTLKDVGDTIREHTEVLKKIK